MTRFRDLRGIVAGILSAFVWSAGIACERPSVAHGPVSRDSAGIGIVENVAAAWSEGDEWLVESVPSLSIGTEDGNSPAAFSFVAGSFRDSRGRIIVLDVLARELRFFGPDGTFLYAAGRPGEGPGEFPSFIRLFPSPLHDFRTLMPWRGDSIVVHGMRYGTLQFLDSAGVEGRRVTSPALREWVQGVWGGDRLLLSSSDGSPAGPPSDGWANDILFAMRGDGAVDSLGLFPWVPEAEWESHRPHGFWTPLADGFVAGRSDRPELLIHDWDGKLHRIVRLPIKAQPVPDSVRESAAESAVDLPIIDRLATDHQGYLWIASQSVDFEVAADALHVVAPDGIYLGEVKLPPGLHPVDIGADWILGIWHDDFDIEYLQLHALDRRLTR